MRLLIISQYFWPENFRINDLARLMAKDGVKIDILTGCPNYPEGASFGGYSPYRAVTEKHTDGYIIHRIPIITRGKSSNLRLFLNYLSFILSGIVFGTYMLRGVKYDLIFVYGVSPIFQAVVGIYFKFLKKVPLITWIQDLWPESIELTGHVKNKSIIFLVSMGVNWVYRQHNLLLTQSRSFINSVKPRAGTVPIKYFPNPGDDYSNRDDFNPPFSANNLFVKPGFNIVFAGNLGTVQSLHTILQSAEILRDRSDIRFIFFGSGSLSHWLTSEIQSKQLKHVVLAGRFPASLMPEIFEHASALLVSLISDSVLNQTIPAKLQSYLAAGKPILASLDGEGAQIVIDAKAGIVCPTEDPAALARAILQLCNMNQDQLESMGESGKRYFAQNFEPQTLTRELIGIFAETISKA